MTRKFLAATLLVLTSCAFTTKHDELKKVVAAAPKPSPTETVVPIAATPPAEADEADDTPAPKPVVTSQPAPGLKDIGKPSDEADEKADKDDAAPTTADEKTEKPEIAISLKPAAKAEAKDETAAPAKKAAHVSGVPAEQSLKWLTNGNIRYVKKNFRGDGRSQTERDRTKASQHPHAIVLACSDSRVPPELIFDQGIGEIFTIRVAGEALDSSVIASIEYAIENFDTHLLVVMGHTNCGAVEAAMKVGTDDEPKSASLDKLLAEIRPHLKTRTSEKPSKDLQIESALNADGVARDLLQRSALVKERVDSGQLTVKSALYWLDSGKVTFY